MKGFDDMLLLYKSILFLMIGLFAAGCASAQTEEPLPTVEILFKGKGLNKTVLKELTKKSFQENCKTQVVEGDADFVLLIDYVGASNETGFINYTLLQQFSKSSFGRVAAKDDDEGVNHMMQTKFLYITSWNSLSESRDDNKISAKICEDYKDNYEVLFERVDKETSESSSRESD